MKIFQKTPVATACALGCAMLVAGCGGSSSGGSGEGEPVASRGVITGFGSVYVNGRRFDTDDSRFEVDDDNGDESDLRIGMVVTVYGYSDNDGEYADEIIYDNELKGPVSAIVIDPADASVKTLTILGQSVIVNSHTTIDDDGALTYDTIAIGDVLEVSGLVGDGVLVATHIELQDDDDEIEIKGLIENLAADSFEIKGFPISYGPATEIDDDIDVLENGLYVEVEGELDGAGTTLIAEEIEAEDDGFDDDAGEVEIEGVVANYDPGNMTFTLQGLTIDAATAELEPASLVLDNGLYVEAEGYLLNGVLIADEVELEDD
ncbi:MAG: DUF5666 domain-containing protein [Gammaproteobacteria bacterium]|nr:DUF5666 domain-containing protein [Gammaproteobacteria bacterium]